MFLLAVDLCSQRSEQQLRLICEHHANSCSSVEGVSALVLLKTMCRYSLESIAITAT
jgi:hypothetical protein